MLADERKRCKIMIESYRRIPRRLTVTLLATRAQLAFMFVVARVAGHACCAQFYFASR